MIESRARFAFKAAAERSWRLIFAGVNPRFDKLRPARRFLNILKKSI
jgi:hypothetical protein